MRMGEQLSVKHYRISRDKTTRKLRNCCFFIVALVYRGYFIYFIFWRSTHSTEQSGYNSRGSYLMGPPASCRRCCLHLVAVGEGIIVLRVRLIVYSVDHQKSKRLVGRCRSGANRYLDYLDPFKS